MFSYELKEISDKRIPKDYVLEAKNDIARHAKYNNTRVVQVYLYKRNYSTVSEYKNDIRRMEKFLREEGFAINKASWFE